MELFDLWLSTSLWFCQPSVAVLPDFLSEKFLLGDSPVAVCYNELFGCSLPGGVTLVVRLPFFG